MNKNYLAIAFAVLFPSLVTFAYFVVLAGEESAIQQAAYAVGKTIQFAFPAVWVFWMLREKWQWSGTDGRGVASGAAFGLVVAALILGLYHLWLKPAGFFEEPSAAIRTKIVELGLREAWKYAALGVFYALCHSLLEEYYWRWFVFRQLDRLTSFSLALAVSSVGFMAHHVILLATYFGWQSPATYLFSAAVAVGGGIWAWMYKQSGTLAGPWLSHCLVDAAIFAVGFDLARDLFR